MKDNDSTHTANLYLYDAKQNLAECFDYAISNCRFNADIFSRLFVQSGYADKFERGNPAIVSGISGIELGSGNHYVRLYELQISRKNIFLRNVLKSIGLVGLWQSISGLPVDDSKIFFQEYLFQKLLQCIAYIMKWI